MEQPVGKTQSLNLKKSSPNKPQFIHPYYNTYIRALSVLFASNI